MFMKEKKRERKGKKRGTAAIDFATNFQAFLPREQRASDSFSYGGRLSSLTS
jgi:hypothetical protein